MKNRLELNRVSNHVYMKDFDTSLSQVTGIEIVNPF